MTPEARARQTIDALLMQAGWHVCDVANANIHAGTGTVKGVAIREFPLNAGHGFADYLLYVNGKACGVIEAKKAGATLSGVGVQSARYAQGLPATLPAWRRPLPFVFESTGVETRFTNGLDPTPRARPLFAFFRPELLLQWLIYLPDQASTNTAQEEPGTFLARLQHMPPLVTEWGQGGASFQLWPAQITAIENLEKKAGSHAVAESVPSMQQHVRGMYDVRQELIANGVLALAEGLCRFTQDYSFSSPSTAAAVVLGRSANGRIEWKDAKGRTLKELQEAEAGI